MWIKLRSLNSSHDINRGIYLLYWQAIDKLIVVVCFLWYGKKRKRKNIHLQLDDLCVNSNREAQEKHSISISHHAKSYPRLRRIIIKCIPSSFTTPSYA